LPCAFRRFTAQLKREEISLLSVKLIK